MSLIDTQEHVRTEEEIVANNNPLGEAAASFVLAFNSAVARDRVFPQQIDLRAYRIKNDPQYSDHVRIEGYHRAGENAGGPTTRKVIIHTAPMGITKHTVRFVNFGREEEKKDLHFGQIGILVQEIVAYIFTGDTHNQA